MTIHLQNTLEQLLGLCKPSDQMAIRLMAENKTLWIPQSERQWRAILSLADELYFGGGGGGGKTDLALGLAVTAHKRSLILRRESTQMRGILERSREIIGDRGRLNENTGIWHLADGRVIELGGCKNEQDKARYQGRPHDLVAFDEAPEFLQSQIDFITGWARTEDPDQRVRILYTGNPPRTAEGRWIVKKFAPWLERGFKRPAGDGELRWYAVVDGDEVWVDGPEPFTYDGELLTPTSRTFISSRVADNPYYVATGYESRLQALPEPLRSQILHGDFTAGMEDNPYQVIPTQWIELAQERWKARKRPETPLTALGVDVARGGKDQTVIAPRYDNWYAPLEKWPGVMTPDGPSVAALVITALGKTRQARINIDVIGVGSSAYDILANQRGLFVVGINFAEGTNARDKSGQQALRNKRAQAYWQFREALDPESGDDIALPDDPELLADLTAPRWKPTVSGILIESKEDIVKRIGRSPDCGDAVVMAAMQEGILIG